MNPDKRIFVAGHRGLVGSAITCRLQAAGFTNLLLRTHSELDLRDRGAVQRFFARERPDYVFLAAAKVGGILANNSAPGEFLFENILIQTNVIHEAYESGVERLLFLGSSCVYPKHAAQPIKEEYLLSGALEPTNRPYAIAKISGIEMCWAYNRQYGTRFIAVMPTNLYGPNDNYNAHGSHVIPALIRKVHDAKMRGSNSVVIWGSGNPRREFLYSNDAADACIWLMNLPDRQFAKLTSSEEEAPLVNIGCGKDISIRNLAELIMEIVDIRCKLTFDTSKPDGTPRKLLDVSLLDSLGWKPSIPLREGIALTYQEYCQRFAGLQPLGESHGTRTQPGGVP